jgi:phosphoglucomutase
MDYIFQERKRMGTLSDKGVMYDTIVTSDLGRKIAHSYGLSTESFLTGFKYIGDRINHYEETRPRPGL